MVREDTDPLNKFLDQHPTLLFFGGPPHRFVVEIPQDCRHLFASCRNERRNYANESAPENETALQPATLVSWRGKVLRLNQWSTQARLA